MSAVNLGRVEPGSDAWMKLMTASKIAAVVGLSPYESRFSLWHKMAGTIPAEPQSDVMTRGHYLEPAICAWFADRHPEFVVTNGDTWAHEDRPWQAASPDRLLYGGEPTSARVLEVKTASNSEDWGPSGGDVIPVGYRAQVIWQLDTLGLQTAHVAVLTAFLEFREYVIEYDADEAAYLRSEARKFLDSLPGGPAEARPDIDSSTQTYEAVKLLHPDITSDVVELDRQTALDYLSACEQHKRITATKQLATSRVLDALGDGKKATYLGKTIATRESKGGGTPFLKVGRSLPTLDSLEAA